MSQPSVRRWEWTFRQSLNNVEVFFLASSILFVALSHTGSEKLTPVLKKMWSEQQQKWHFCPPLLSSSRSPSVWGWRFLTANQDRRAWNLLPSREAVGKHSRPRMDSFSFTLLELLLPVKSYLLHVWNKHGWKKNIRETGTCSLLQ